VDIAKRVYVNVAWHEFNVPGKKPTASRVAVLSGLTRKDVHRLLADPVEDQSETFERYNRAAKVTTGWARDAEFLDPRGKTRALDFEGDQSFSTLVKREEQASVLAQGVDSLGRARGASFAAYQKGVVSLIEVLQADENLLRASDARAQAQTESARAAVTAFKALGGGWQPSGTDAVATR